MRSATPERATGTGCWNIPSIPDRRCGRAGGYPEVLINGDHEKVDKWRRKQQLQRTMEKRPDMFSRLELSDEEDLALLRQIKKEAGRMKLTEEVTCRPAAAGDIPVIMDMVAEAKKSLGRFHVDQWQGDYPRENIFRDDISRGECFLLLHGDEPAPFCASPSCRSPAMMR